MDFTLTTAQEELGGLSRQILTDRVTQERLREIEAGATRFDPALWSDLATAGVLSAALPESVGGAGLGLLEQCSVLVEIGRTVAPVPYLASIVLGASALAAFGTPDQQERWAAPAGARRGHPRRGPGRGRGRGPASRLPADDGPPGRRRLAAHRRQDHRARGRRSPTCCSSPPARRTARPSSWSRRTTLA